MVGRPINENKMLAELNGEKTYRGSSHGCGTNERYTNGGGCVHCARRKTREQREALERERSAGDSDRHVIAETFLESALDSRAKGAVEEIEFQKSIDDLM